MQLAIEPAIAASLAGSSRQRAGWIALALATAAAVLAQLAADASTSRSSRFFVAALVAIIALTSLRWDTGNWLAFHTLLVGLTAAAWLLPLATLAVESTAR